MSLPSIPNILREKGLAFDGILSNASIEEVLVEAMRRDLPLAVNLLKQTAKSAEVNEGQERWLEDPNSAVGKQLIRLHASDALRPLASKHFCGGAPLTFINCCGGIVGKKPPPTELFLLQIQMQAGPIAYADC